MALHHHHKGQKGHNMVGCNHHILAVVVTILTTCTQIFFPLLFNFFCQRENINVFRFYVSVQEICPSDLKAMDNALKSTEKVGCHTVCSCSKPGSRTDISTTKSCFDFRLVLFFLTKIQCYVTYFLAQQYIFGSPMSTLCKALLYSNIWPFLTRTVAWTQGIDRLVDI